MNSSGQKCAPYRGVFDLFPNSNLNNNLPNGLLGAIHGNTSSGFSCENC